MGGIWSLSQVSRVDRFVREVRAIQNPSEREKAAQKALANLASGGKTIRFIGFSLCALGCGVGLFAKQEETTIHGTEEKSLYPYAAIFCSIIIAYSSFLIKR